MKMAECLTSDEKIKVTAKLEKFDSDFGKNGENKKNANKMLTTKKKKLVVWSIAGACQF